MKTERYYSTGVPMAVPLQKKPHDKKELNYGQNAIDLLNISNQLINSNMLAC